VYQPENWKDGTAKAIWGQLNIDLAVVVAYGHILPRWMLDSCRLGAWNLHFSLLPRWRGASPVYHAISAGDQETGITLMRIAPGLDEGPLLAQTKRQLTGQETSDHLFRVLAKDAADLLRVNLPTLIGGSAAPSPQDDRLATFAPKLKKEMARLDLTKDPMSLHRQIRAQQPWPGAEIQIESSKVKILAVGEIAPSDSPPGTLRWGRGGVWLTVGGNGAIELLVLKREGKPPMTSNRALQHFGRCGPIALIP
jgi:methionyl-tRNA formyltransferase